ncbi:polar amino acid transport system permease protein [Caldanaerobacter subterraneus subsp. tengcongensis MB4]|uniref:ABC-type amino acid transport system, permease component n=1 Tax=Caldanaerobacter subterraneus subsp. tengcongensis (strain DSM 15242 / JCM 11007 / NBRC 100824 / MB4) TaxID=273068 RepID=Q8RCC3_CALS4|nr:amino acid ABC transporter permease [Caldanaerobacter subterraneus]4YMS_C Chain C, ABC-type amino acid transport system, permease component [Caldanaerobacter subterraneus subsp. tengcongensis MB4]4YMS_D Chain D, ABC-type amino acid transport system, permease component [Caldanaerobacter subterraneus subsp. tengcongensis MB4]4YMT_B Chain B, ABC-type amino acid transport system, permease component [Caldanaerobacter subterraneus subsp. tengcongensis MB4]4YMT_C Chain C, ABC-type amino acid transp
MTVDFLSMVKYTPLFISGLIMTLKLTFLAVTIGVLMGLFIALMKMSSIKPIKLVASSYIEVIRGTPLLVQLLLIYNGLMQFGMNIPAFTAGVSALAINSSAYVAEIIRAGIQAVDPGQNEAARSLGMTHAMAMRYVIIPQAIKNILPALGNEFIVMLKESAIVSVIGFADLTRQADIIQSVTYRYFEPYIIIAAIYFVMTLTFSKLLSLFERRLRAGDIR